MTEETVQEGDSEWVSTGRAWNATGQHGEDDDIGDISSPVDEPDIGDLNIQDHDEVRFLVSLCNGIAFVTHAWCNLHMFFETVPDDNSVVTVCELQ